MSRLDSFRRRLTAQIDGLNWAGGNLPDMGDVLELGLGNGRTYDHLREHLPDRRIWVVDRVLQAHPSCIPPTEDFLLGEADDMLVELARRGAQMALAHYDFGFGVPEKDDAKSARLSPLIRALMVPGGLVVSQQPILGLTQIEGPETVDRKRYLFYRA